VLRLTLRGSIGRPRLDAQLSIGCYGLFYAAPSGVRYLMRSPHIGWFGYIARPQRVAATTRSTHRVLRLRLHFARPIERPPLWA
jgi:hypothetical protein